jgi:4-hydroxybenzoate polyprenyltransferase
MNPLVKYLDYFFIARPILFLPGWATLIAGHLSSTSRSNFVDLSSGWNIQIEFLNTEILAAMLAFSLAMGGSFILNQLKDLSTDRENDKLFLLGDGHVPIRNGYIESLLFIVLSLTLSARISLPFFLTTALFLLITGYLYNFAPFVLKDKPISGLIANMLMGWLAFAMGWVLASPPTDAMILGSMPYLFFNTSLYFLTTLPDIEGDAASRKITFPVRYGLTFTILASVFSFTAAVIFSLVLNNQVILITLVSVIPFVIRLIIHRTVSSAIMVVKTGILFFCFVISVKLPFCLIVIMSLLLLTRYYYKRRFQFEYPNLKGD